MTTDHPLDETRIRELRNWLYDKANFYGKNKYEQERNHKIRRYRDILKWIDQLEGPPYVFKDTEQQQAAAWRAVTHTLDEWVPDWGHLADTGERAACNAIPFAIQAAWQAGLDEGRRQARASANKAIGDLVELVNWLSS